MRVVWLLMALSFFYDAYRIAFGGYMPNSWLIATAWVVLGLKFLGDSFPVDD